MKTVNIHEAKTQLSKLVEEVSKPFVIAKAGKPVAKVTAYSAPTGAQMRRRMKVLLDTHLLPWAAGHPDRLVRRCLLTAVFPEAAIRNNYLATALRAVLKTYVQMANNHCISAAAFVVAERI